jgi:Gpi18-like mannosyltransferase
MTQGNFDAVSYEIVADIMRHGGNVYAETTRYNYSPVWFHVLDALAHVPRMPLIVVVRLFLSCIDIGNILLIHMIAERYTGHGRIAAVAYALNPGMITLVGQHGQFEALAMLPFLAGILALFSGRRWVAWGCLTASLVIKHNVIFVLWALLVLALGVRRAAIWTLAGGIVWLMTFLHHAPDGAEGIYQNVFNYRGYSYGFVLTTLLPPYILTTLFLVAVFLCPILVRRWRHLSFALLSG